jgi:hypothetical protein
MKRKTILFWFLLVCIFAYSQNAEDKKYLLATNTNTFGLSTASFLDPYLSPLTYTGYGIRFEHEIRRYLSPENINISSQGKYNLEAAYLLNPESSSLMMYVGANYSWGIHYHFRIQKGFQILAGGLFDADFGVKNVLRNINNPVNLDLATNLNLSGIAMYDLKFGKKMLRLQLAAQTPVFGCMFVPLKDASYYEMFELGNLIDVFHVSSLINKRGLNSTFSVDVPFNRSVWRFGFNFMTIKYSANDEVFVRNQLSLVVGTTFDAASFSGKKNKIPKNFISTNE